MSWLAKMAGLAEVPVFVAFGEGAPADAASVLAKAPGLRVVETPRAAAILFVVGTVPKALLPQLHRLHDQLPHPRASALWHSRNELPGATRIEEIANISVLLRAIHRDLLVGSLKSEPDFLSDAPPNEWRGIGPHGQGGKGMMGGKGMVMKNMDQCMSGMKGKRMNQKMMANMKGCMMKDMVNQKAGKEMSEEEHKSHH